MQDANFATGSNGLFAVDKIGNLILFLDPRTHATSLTLDALAPRVHELGNIVKANTRALQSWHVDVRSPATGSIRAGAAAADWDAPVSPSATQ